jgi:hypothetical protein
MKILWYPQIFKKKKRSERLQEAGVGKQDAQSHQSIWQKLVLYKIHKNLY